MPDERAETLRQHLEGLRLRAQAATSWLGSSAQYAQLLNRDGVVPVTARFTADDLAFLANAREELLRFTELGLRLAELHQPQEVSAITSDPVRPVPPVRELHVAVALPDVPDPGRSAARRPAARGPRGHLAARPGAAGYGYAVAAV